MNRTFLTACLSALACLPIASQATVAEGQAGQQSAQFHAVLGTWMNPLGTVKVQTINCGDKLCGHVVWAARQAQSDARDSGVNQLVGVELLHDYHTTGQGHYQGTVYVPDMGHSFYSTIVQTQPNSMRISGCVLGGLICKSQDWHRV